MHCLARLLLVTRLLLIAQVLFVPHVLLIALCALPFITGCESSADPKNAGQAGKVDGGSSPDALRLAVIPKGTSHQFWRSVHAGAEAAAKEIGNIEILWKGPETEADTAGQINVVRNFITNGVDGIVLAPNHSQSLMDVVAEANAENVPVVIFDSGLGEGPKIVSYVATDNHHGGVLAAQRLAEAMDHKGKVIMLRYKAGSESTEQREAGFLEAMAKETNMEVISSDQYAGTKTEEALNKATQLLNKYREEVGGIFAVCEPNCNGVLEALKQTGLAGKVKFVAFDPSDTLIQGLSENTVSGIVLQDPFEMGRQSVIALAKSKRGEKVEAVISTGEYVATAENQNQPPLDRLLRPEKFGQ
ncbi:MAG: substrate-binding domain-containing protein [Pirellulaceae bacterium]|nr:substrate-binding domain-containing protein [Pirellulaceae bacterium]